MNILPKVLIVSLLLFISSTISASDLDDLAAKTGGVSLHLNKAEFNKNPTSFVNALVKQTANPLHIEIIPIPLQESASPTNTVREYSLQTTKDMPALDIQIDSTANIDAIQITDPTNTIVKPLQNVHTLNNNIKTNLYSPNVRTNLYITAPHPGTWHLKITNTRPYTASASYHIEIDKVILWEAYDIPAHSNTKFTFPIDPRLTDLSIVVTAKNKPPTVELINPNQKPENAVSTVAGAAIFKSVAKPTPGIWTANLNSDENFSLQIIGQSSNFIVTQDFQHPVLGHEGMMDVTDHSPLQSGTQRLFQITFYANPQDQLNNFQIILISLSGKTLNTFNVVNNPSVMNTGWIQLKTTITIPPEDFRVMVIGKDNSSSPFQRMGNYLYKVNHQVKPNPN